MIGIRYFSAFGTTGYAQAARRYLTALKDLGLPVTWTPIVRRAPIGFTPFEGRSIGDAELDPICNRPIPYDVALLHITPQFFRSLIKLVPGCRIAAYLVWETDSLPRRWRGYLKDVDLVITPCQWNRGIFEQSGFARSVEVVPHSLESGQAPLPAAGSDREFVFYTISAWSDRKAVDLTLEAFLRAFTSADRVRLVIKTSPRHDMRRIPFTQWSPVSTRRLIQRVLRRHAHPPPVTVITDTLSEDGIRKLHSEGSCFVSLTRGEAWGMGACDAAASARPVIITGFGGHTEFLPPDLAYLIKYRMVKVPFLPAEQFESGQTWAEPDVDHAASLMRHVFENRDESSRRALELASRLCSGYEHKRVGKMLFDALARHF